MRTHSLAQGRQTACDANGRTAFGVRGLMGWCWSSWPGETAESKQQSREAGEDLGQVSRGGPGPPSGLSRKGQSTIRRPTLGLG